MGCALPSVVRTKKETLVRLKVLAKLVPNLSEIALTSVLCDDVREWSGGNCSE